jgi:hypothetical protein
MARDGEIQRVAKGLYAHRDYTPPPNDTPVGEEKRRKPRRSFASVRDSMARTDGATDSRSRQHVQSKEQSGGICPSVASVHENADTNGARASVPTQTDRTDGQMGAEVADRPAKFSSADLSGNLSEHNHATDDRRPPDFLRRAPIAMRSDRAPALGPPGDSLDDLDPWGPR